MVPPDTLPNSGIILSLSHTIINIDELMDLQMRQGPVRILSAR